MFVKKLSWDSDFFEVKVGSISLNELSNAELNRLLKSLNEDLFSVCYVFLQKPIELQHFKDNLVLKVDTKVIFKKPILDYIEVKNVNSYNLPKVSSQLLNLALDSGIESRFKKDSNFKTGMFHKMYTLWIENTVNKKIADDVLVYQIKNDIIGFVTVKKNKNTVHIGLIAVNENHRGKGIAKTLMQAAQNWGIENECTFLQVVTQKDNIAACNLYSKFNMQLFKQEYVYHIWNLAMLT